MPAKKQPKKSPSSPLPEQPSQPVVKDGSITDLVKNLSDWLDMNTNQAALSNAINTAITEYETVRHSRQYPLGEPDEVAEPATMQQEEDWMHWTAQKAAALATAVANGARFTFATGVDYTLGNSVEELKKRYVEVNAENARMIFLELNQLKGGWDADNHVQGVIGIGAASLKTRIVAKVIDAMSEDSNALDEDTFTVVDYPGECLTASQRLAHAVYNQLIGYRAAKHNHPEVVTEATTMSPPGGGPHA